MFWAVVTTVITTALFAKNRKSGAPAPSGPPALSPGAPAGQELQQLALHQALVGRLDGATYTPGPGAELLPMVVLLHGEGDDPAALRSVLPPSRPLRVVTLLGRLDDGNGRRRYLDPLLQGTALRTAQLRETDDIGLAVIAATQRFPVDGALVIVGVGGAGAMALAEAMRGPAWFRAAFGAGGVLTADWVPDGKAPASPPRLFKLSYGDAVGFDQLAAQKAAGLGWPLVVDQGDVDVIGASPDAATVRAWLATRWSEEGLGAG
ncbi:hypothetical protein SAMN02745121_08713 [Nannocystis exedens]|uniref:Phospholipase/carboxylesterase n=1 Tax=Nannocystis exedens TaxID=54 RepID=A0A1I2IIT5_9BACT|nr:hypothetical protein [Nannocystis exedens]PCC73133.1 hypothetical protein NAEX_06221 [Nannocystis exedens]SFF41558.1 hypothetical protein SAMN02745121_08713 [Nannocystis exedens]